MKVDNISRIDIESSGMCVSDKATSSQCGRTPQHNDDEMTVPTFELIDTGADSLTSRSSPTTMALHQLHMLPFVLLLVPICLLVRQLKRPKRKQPHTKTYFPSSTNLPPCRVPAHPIYAHMPHVFSPPDSPMFEAVFRHQADPNSGLSTFRFLSEPSVGVLKAEHARTLLRHCTNRQGNRIFTRHFKKSLGQDAMIMLDGGDSDKEKWRQHRNLVKAAFTSNAVQNMADKVWEVANGFSSSLLRESSESSDGKARLEAAEIFKWATLDIFGRVAFDHRFGCTETLSDSALMRSLDRCIEDNNDRCKPRNLINPFLQFYCLPTRRNKEFARNIEEVHSILRNICRTRMDEIDRSRCNPQDVDNLGKNHDLLTSLLKSKAESKPGPVQDEVIDELTKMLLTLLFAGYDTSSVLLSMAMWSMVQHPEIQKECAREAFEASASLHEDASQWESQLAYCHAVILETIRLHPPVYTNSRNLTKDIVLDGCTIPQGTRVYIPIMQIHTDSRNFARAKDFLPERWVRRDVSSGRWVARDHHAEPKYLPEDPSYLPPANSRNLFAFSDGARNCVGHRLALQESTMVFACLVRDLDVDLREGFEMRKRKKFALATPEEMPLIFSKREWKQNDGV